jgi:hypothetical protein
MRTHVRMHACFILEAYHMPARLKYRNKRTFNSNFEKEFFEAFSKRCLEKNKDRNEMITELIEEWMKRDDSDDILSLQQLKLSIFSSAIRIGCLQQQQQNALADNDSNADNIPTISHLLARLPTLEEWNEAFRNTENPQEIGSVQGYGTNLSHRAKLWISELNKQRAMSSQLRGYH